MPRGRAGAGGRAVFIDLIDRRQRANLNLSARAASRYQIMTSFKIPPRRNARATRVGSIGRSIGRPFGSYPVLFHPNPHPLHRLARRRGAVGTCTFLFCCCCHLFSRPREKHGRRRGRVRRRRRLRRQT